MRWIRYGTRLACLPPTILAGGMMVSPAPSGRRPDTTPPTMPCPGVKISSAKPSSRVEAHTGCSGKGLGF
jgi:hypothetical protein